MFSVQIDCAHDFGIITSNCSFRLYVERSAHLLDRSQFDFAAYMQPWFPGCVCVTLVCIGETLVYCGVTLVCCGVTLVFYV